MRFHSGRCRKGRRAGLGGGLMMGFDSAVWFSHGQPDGKDDSVSDGLGLWLANPNFEPVDLHPFISLVRTSPSSILFSIWTTETVGGLG